MSVLEPICVVPDEVNNVNRAWRLNRNRSKSMKVSDTVTSKAKHEHRQVNQSTGNGTKVPNSQGKKVERTLKSKNNLQQADIVQVPERKPRGRVP